MLEAGTHSPYQASPRSVIAGRKEEREAPKESARDPARSGTDLAVVQEPMKALGYDLVGVSTDTQFAHFAWLTSEKLLAGVKYPLAADPTGRISRLFGVYDGGSGLALRGTFVISPEGLLVSSEVNFYNVGRNASELLRKAEANAYLRKHPNEACPARWTPGAKTLVPGKNLVGKVFEALQ